jgi:hypothetical protein
LLYYRICAEDSESLKKRRVIGMKRNNARQEERSGKERRKILK